MRNDTIHKASAILGILLSAAVAATPIQAQAMSVNCVVACDGPGSLLDWVRGLFLPGPGPTRQP